VSFITIFGTLSFTIAVQPRPLAVNMALPALRQSCSSTAATEPTDRLTNGFLLTVLCFFFIVICVKGADVNFVY